MLKYYMKHSLKKVFFIIFTLITIVFTIYTAYSSKAKGVEPWDIHYFVINKIAISILIPSFLIIKHYLTNVFYSYKVLIRYKSSKEWFIEYYKASFIVTLLYIVLLNFLFTGILFLIRLDIFDIYLFVYLFFSIIIQILGFNLISCIYDICLLRSNNKGFSFFITYFIIFFITFFVYALRLEEIDALNIIFINPNSPLMNWVIQIIILSNLFIVLPIFSGVIIKDDIYWRK